MTLRSAFTDQSGSCARLGSPFMAQLCGILAAHWPANSRLGQRCAAFEGDLGPAGVSVPLRVAGGLHALVLSRRAPSLAAVYPPETVSDDRLCAAVMETLEEHEEFILNWIESAPQTNEVRRSAALMAGAAVAGEHFNLPLWLSELGASGGLNLMWDRFALNAGAMRLGADAPVLTLSPDWSGPPPPSALPRVAARAGVDLNPLDPHHPDDLLRLTAFLWPDQPDRLRMTQAAAAVMDAPIAKEDAIDWLASRLSAAPAGHLHMVQHTVAWQYFPRAAQERGHALFEAAGKTATEDRPLAWLAMESDGDTTGAFGAALTLRMWPGDITLSLARVDFHGRWVRWADHV